MAHPSKPGVLVWGCDPERNYKAYQEKKYLCNLPNKVCILKLEFH